MESNINKKFNSVYITVRLSPEVNRLLSESAQRSHRKKLQEVNVRLEDHLKRFRSISETDYVIPVE